MQGFKERRDTRPIDSAIDTRVVHSDVARLKVDGG